MDGVLSFPTTNGWLRYSEEGSAPLRHRRRELYLTARWLWLVRHRVAVTWVARADESSAWLPRRRSSWLNVNRSGRANTALPVLASSAMADSSGVDPPMSAHALEAADTEMELPSPSPSPRHVRYSEHTLSSDVASPVSENRRRSTSMHDVGLPRKLSFNGNGVDSLVKTTRCAARLCGSRLRCCRDACGAGLAEVRHGSELVVPFAD
jgi:hypothetical protein